MIRTRPKHCPRTHLMLIVQTKIQVQLVHNNTDCTQLPQINLNSANTSARVSIETKIHPKKAMVSSSLIPSPIRDSDTIESSKADDSSSSDEVSTPEYHTIRRQTVRAGEMFS